MPHFGQVVVTCNDKFSETKEKLLDYISEDSRLRDSLDMVFVNITRPFLRRLEIAFKPSLTRIQWMSKDLNMYLTYVGEKLIEIGDILQRVRDISDFHIKSLSKSIANIELIDLPEEAIDMKLLMKRNIEHRKIVG